MPDEKLPAGFWSLVDAACTDMLDDADHQQLQAILRESELARRTYLEYCRMHSELRFTLGMQRATQSALQQSATSTFAEQQPPATSHPKSPVLGFLGDIMGNLHWPAAPTTFWALIALISCASTLVLVCVLALNGGGWRVKGGGQDNVASQISNLKSASSLHPSPTTRHPSVARLTRTSDCQWANDSPGPAIRAVQAGDWLASGRKLVLEAGLAAITFNKGASIIVEGPATIELTSDNSARLAAGKLTALVPAQAIGFAVQTPASQITDLGTEFGVAVDGTGQTDLHVFQGKVQLTGISSVTATDQSPATASRGSTSNPSPANPEANASGSPSTHIFSANESAHIEKPQGNAPPVITHQSANPNQFVRTMPDRMPFPLFSTGIGVKVGETDQHWELKQISTNPAFKSRPAVVRQPGSKFAHDEHGKAQWITNSINYDAMPKGCRWTLCTHFDLTGLDPATAQIAGRIVVDDDLVEIRLNGKKVTPPKPHKINYPSAVWHPLKIEEGFVAGDNKLEIVIQNRAAGMGMCVDWKGSARPLAIVGPSTISTEH